MSQDNNPLPSRFTPEVEADLRRSGWYPGRQVDEQMMEKWYAIPFHLNSPRCHLMFPAAYHFLREFGNLAIGPWSAPSVQVALFPLDEYFEEEKLLTCEWRIESKLFPIGYYSSQPYYQLLIDISGRIWASTEELELIGDDTDEAIHNLMVGAEPKKIINFTKTLGDFGWGLSERVFRRQSENSARKSD